MMNNILIILSYLLLACSGTGPQNTTSQKEEKKESIKEEKTVLTGADQVQNYLPLLKDKKVALVVNQTSVIGNTHIVDSLLKHKVNIIKILAPEHGFRGDADAGEDVANSIDKKTNLPLISIYGNNKKPTAEQLKDIDVVIFDIQDVGTRFFTYISTMHYVMEACAENNKEFIVLDRPNPNGEFIDGPVLQAENKSFIGMHPIPILHGLTVGELAQMINGQKWLDKGVQCKLTVIPNKNYSHSSRYSLKIKPSPNLPNDQSIRLYPTVCLFEGTPISVGRGTHYPFQVIGAPEAQYGEFTFTPVSIPGMSKNPPHENKKCYGDDLRNAKIEGLSLKLLIDYYNKSPKKESFFIPFFDKLSGNKNLKEQIKKGMSEEDIKATWKKDLDGYREMRKKYTLYND